MISEPSNQSRRSPAWRGAARLLLLLVAGAAFCSCGRQEPRIIQVEPRLLEAYAGDYQPSPDTVVTVARVEGHLELQVNHQSSMPFLPETKDTFVHPVSSTRISFGTNEVGAVTHLVLNRDGQKSAARRIVQSSDARQPQKVVVDGHEFRFLSKGSGRPTVILWGGIDSWKKVQRDVAGSAQAVSFDHTRAATNVGASIPRKPSEAAHELHRALKDGNLAPPYIMVGHSFGAAVVRVFASLYPNDVAGLVLVDPFQEGFLDWLKIHQPENHDQLVSQLGRSYVSDWDGTLAELRAACSFPDLPVVLLSATHRTAQTGNAFEQGIPATALAEGSAAVVEAHREWLSKIPKGQHRAVDGSSHDIPGEHPEAVVDAIKTLIEQVRPPRQ